MATEAVLDRAWALAPTVAVRPERFGALLYHFGTRRLSFVKDRRLLTVIEALADSPSALEACTTAGVTASDLPAYERALSRLVETDMLQERMLQERMLQERMLQERMLQERMLQERSS